MSIKQIENILAAGMGVGLAMTGGELTSSADRRLDKAKTDPAPLNTISWVLAGARAGGVSQLASLSKPIPHTHASCASTTHTNPDKQKTAGSLARGNFHNALRHIVREALIRHPLFNCHGPP